MHTKFLQVPPNGADNSILIIMDTGVYASPITGTHFLNVKLLTR
jgi:hypothetical protein